MPDMQQALLHLAGWLSLFKTSFGVMENCYQEVEMNIAIYVRTSKRDMHPENQKLQLVEHCKVKEWEYTVFEEMESTRKTRPIKQDVLAQLRQGKFQGVLIWKLDRWARSLQELIMDIDNITARNKEFIVLTQPIDTTSASGRLFMQILGAFAEFEREIIRERTIAGLDRARAKGIKLGRPRKKNVIKQGGFTYTREK